MKKITLKPQNEFVVVKENKELEDAQMQTNTGLYTGSTEGARQYHGKYGTVMAVADDIHIVKEGDTVVFNKYDAVPIQYDGDEMQILKAELILAVLA